MIDLLAKPITDLLGAFGSGVIPSGGPADVIRASSSALDSVQNIGRSAVSELAYEWSGPAASAAIELAGQAHASAVALSDNGTEIAAIVDRACEKVHAGLAELQMIAHSFVAVATSAAPLIFTPPAQSMVIAAAIDHLQRALAVVARVRGELAAHAAEIGAFAAPPPVPEPAGTPPPTTSAAAVVEDPGARFARAFSDSVSTRASSALPDLTSSSTAPQSSQQQSSPPSTSPAVASDRGMSTLMATPDGSARSIESGATGRGVEVALPDGSIAVAPNEEAAGAVRSALTQQGVPYVWGGTQPGRGLDCSGLTQWAYGEHGVELPRLAQEQNIGSQVGYDDLMPGDLAVWDGHVAMVIGNGQLVEAGNPVQVGDIRTTNSGMAFKGFYRPTE